MTMISYDEAYRLTLENIQTLEAEDVPLVSATDRVTASDLTGQVDSPSRDVSLKDGYAVHSEDIAKTHNDAPVRLRLVGSVAAGGSCRER